MDILDQVDDIENQVETEKTKLCGNRSCSKAFGHKFKCNKLRKITSLRFTKQNVSHTLKSTSEKLKVLAAYTVTKEESLEELDQQIHDKEKQIVEIVGEKKAIEDDIKELNVQYEKIRVMLEQKGYARTRREKLPTDEKMISDNFSSTRYRRRNETKNILQFLHGGIEGSIYGAWDYFKSIAAPDIIEKLFITFKRGKFLEKLTSKFQENDIVSMNKAVAVKYFTYQSRRKYSFLCKIQKSTYDPTSESFGKNKISYGEYNLDVSKKPVSNALVDSFVKSLDIGQLHQIQGYSGVSRTVTALVTMIVDLNLKVPALYKKLIWFNGNTNHFVVEFSDDGAPESAERTMTIGTLSLWNYGNRIRSRDFHYLLHMLSASEKDEVCETLWQQHCEEMQLIENNVLVINGIRCTFEFVPSADTAWLCFAANVLGCSATYPSPFANVHKGDLTEMGGSIGTVNDRWQVPTKESRENELTQLKEFQNSNVELNEELRHKQELEFMAENGIRQLGTPRIGDFANKICPEPLHLEVNSWQHVLDVIYKESVRRGRFENFISTLKSPPKVFDIDQEPGCGLGFIANEIKKHYEIESKRMKRLETRLVGSQAISLAQYSFRLVDALYFDNETPCQQVQRMALAKICEVLRDIGSLINKINIVDDNYPKNVETLCTNYFNLFSLFFKQHCQLTVWTMGYVIPYNVKRVYAEFKVGFGITSMQGKEAKHSAIKQELRNNTNRSTAHDNNGKWHQIARSNYVRKFYLQFHFPVSNYHSHYRQRKAVSDADIADCACSRNIVVAGEQLCQTCFDSGDVMSCVQQAKLTACVLDKIYPVKCTKCPEQFADQLELKNHDAAYHVPVLGYTAPKQQAALVPRKMSVNELKTTLKQLGMNISGTKVQLQKRLEGRLTEI